MRIAYETWKPGTEARRLINLSNEICAAYATQGYDLTLRQLFYQHVARGNIPNTQRAYKNLGDVINRARLAGYLDWDYIVDRTRSLKSLGHWDSPREIVETVARQFRIDHWDAQPTRVEVWVEKEALAGVMERTANRNDVGWFSCRGYVSQSELWGAAQRIGGYINAGQNVVILHLGDHDPSGIDMTRDIIERLMKFIMVDWAYSSGCTPIDAWDEMQDALLIAGAEPLHVKRIALNMDQVQAYNPPPNPAKLTDSRSTSYVQNYGDESWELDALNPQILDQLIQDEIDAVLDDEAMEESRAKTRTGRSQLAEIANRWGAVEEHWDDLLQLLDSPTE